MKNLYLLAILVSISARAVHAHYGYYSHYYGGNHGGRDHGGRDYEGREKGLTWGKAYGIFIKIS